MLTFHSLFVRIREASHLRLIYLDGAVLPIRDNEFSTADLVYQMKLLSLIHI